ncbi:hypothetical protein [Candidatus Vondammii sp. HM_W22]
MAARFGGEEFAVILPHIPTRMVLIRLIRLIRLLSRFEKKSPQES